jgi:hypothetical protein
MNEFKGKPPVKPESPSDNSAVKSAVAAVETPQAGIAPAPQQVMVSSMQAQATEMIQAAQGLPPKEQVIKVIEQMSEEDPMALPPECMNNQHPEFRFCWVSAPTTEPRKAAWTRRLASGYVPCNSMTPTPSFWNESQKPGSLHRFASDGAIHCQGMILMVTYQDAYALVLRKQKERSLGLKETLESDNGIKPYGDNEKNLPEAMKGSKMSAKITDDGKPEYSEQLAPAMAAFAEN